jgi:hypothetical protein
MKAFFRDRLAAMPEQSIGIRAEDRFDFGELRCRSGHTRLV